MSDVLERVDQYANWRRLLAGENQPRHEGEVWAGFYRNHGDAVAYWFGKDGAVRCRINDVPQEFQRSMEVWPFASKKPVAYESYLARIATGNWPSESDAVSEDLRDNDTSYEGLQRRIGKLESEARTLVDAGPATTQEAADRASDIASRLSGLWKTADTMREAEKRPHLEASRQVDDKWRPLLNTATIYTTLKAAVMEPFLKKKKAEKDEAERKAIAEAAAAKAIAEEAAAKAAELAKQSNAPNELIEQQAKEAAQAAADAEAKAQQVASQKVHAGTRGRVTGLRVKPPTVTIVERDLVLAHFADRAEVTAILQMLAEQAVKAGETVPGVQVTKNEGAA